ncbi:MAG: peptidase S41 [Lachnospiraceae bacterium]|nr:peptidase S41 [Lachnospiraceae bacterium]
MNSYDIFLIAAELLGAGVLFWLGGYAEQVRNSKWRICYALPFALCLLAAALSGFEISMLSVYLGAILLLGGFLLEKKTIRRTVSAAAGVLIAAALPVCLLYGGYRQPDFVKDFEKGFQAMKEHYVLSEHKGIDWDELYEKYLPRFEEADRAHDEELNYIAWTAFCQEFYDGHVSFTARKSEVEMAAQQRFCGKDYGLSLMTLSDGRTAAVNVQEGGALEAAGIRNGTIITAWNGETISEAADRAELTVMSFPDKDNEAFYRALLVAGMGEEEITITYLDDEGKACEVSVQQQGFYYERLKETMEILDQGLEAGNLSLTGIDEDTYVLRIKGMMYDTDSMADGDYVAMQSQLREQLLSLRQEGAKNLIIDLRGNGGGSGAMVMALAELFAPEGEHYYVTDAVWDEQNACYQKDEKTGTYMPGTVYTYQGEDVWKDGEIVILVNAQSVSASDHFVKVMRGMEHVTVAGFTKPNGSAQGISVLELESGALSFSASLLLDQEGEVFIDSGTERIGGNDVDVRIPFDEEAVRALFDDGEDYLLKKVCMKMFTK